MQLLVEQCLKELADVDKTGTKIKSLKGGVEVLVSNRVKWPHEYVRHKEKKRLSYDPLSVTQWVAGFIRIMTEEKMLMSGTIW